MRYIPISIIIIFCFYYSLVGQNKNTFIQVYEDSLNRYEQIAYDLHDIRLVEYINICEEFLEFFKKEKNDPRLINYNIQIRKRMQQDLLSSNPKLKIKRVLIEEQKLYSALVNNIPYKDLIYGLKVRTILANRKYFEKDDESKGSILELWLNDQFKFTSSKLTDLKKPQYGIRSWEINVRFEPIGFIVEKDWTGLLFSFGSIYNFFPDIQQENDDVIVKETLYSRYLKRTGFKFGIGGRFEDKLLWHTGVGLQLRAFTLWSLYSFKHEKVYYAVGINDLSWIKFFIPYINIGF